MTLDGGAFTRAYREVVIGNHFFEEPGYYVREEPRYRTTLEAIEALQLPRGARMLEIGGGQIALLGTRLLGLDATLGDVGDTYADAVTRHGVQFVRCDLVRDDLPQKDHYDLVVLCEVVEHVPIPLHLVLEKVKGWMRPGGKLFVTTPNLYRLRNVVRLALGLRVFDHFFYPEPGHSLGHPFEYSPDHLRWHVERAGFRVRSLEERQLGGGGSRAITRAARLAARPLQLVPRWRDTLVLVAEKV